MRCDAASATLAELADGAEVAPGPARDHVERCLRCQAELAQHRRIRRSLAQLRGLRLDPGPELVASVLHSVESVQPGRGGWGALHRHRAAYVAAATAATAAGAVLLASRSRRTRLSPTG